MSSNFSFQLETEGYTVWTSGKEPSIWLFCGTLETQQAPNWLDVPLKNSFFKKIIPSNFLNTMVPAFFLQTFFGSYFPLPPF